MEDRRRSAPRTARRLGGHLALSFAGGERYPSLSKTSKNAEGWIRGCLDDKISDARDVKRIVDQSTSPRQMYKRMTFT